MRHRDRHPPPRGTPDRRALHRLQDARRDQGTPGRQRLLSDPVRHDTARPLPAARYVGRFAPSPTGPLHIGSLACALASFLDARAAGGRWLVRIEDIDPPREVAGAASAILHALEAHALPWDGEVLFQSSRQARYEQALQQLARDGHAFRCSLSRAQLAAGGGVHPGRATSSLQFDENGGHAWRFEVPAGDIHFDDRIQGACHADLAATEGAFVIRRRDNLYAYQLAVVVDDADQGVTDIVRGYDLLESTPRQLLLQAALGVPRPRYAHIPVLLDDTGAKLSKQAHAAPVTADRRLDNLRLALRALGQPDHPDAASAAELVALATMHWQIANVPHRAGIALSALC